MRRTLLNDGWSFRPRTSSFTERHLPVVDWTAVTLPHDVMIGTERSPSAPAANAFFSGGSWEYRRTLEVTEEEADGVVLLELEGVYRDAVTIVNGSIAAQRPYGYSPFVVPLHHLLAPGEENEILVRARAGDDSRWYSGAGIHRNVWLLRSGPVRLLPNELHVTTPEIDRDVATVMVAMEVANDSIRRSELTVRVEVVDAGGAIVAEDAAPLTVFPGDTATLRRRLSVAAPRLWDLDDPQLYTCRVALLADGDEIDSDEVTFGIRTLSLDAQRGLRLNGTPILLRGACVHHDNGPLGAAAIDRAEERRVELLKAAGFNAIRSAHNPMSRAMLDACDRIGMLVMDESFDMWTESKTEDDYASRFEEWWQADIDALVRNGRNHPSVAFYSVGNEIPNGSTATGLQIARALADAVRTLDPTRYVTQAVSGLLAAGPAAFGHLREEMAAEDDGSEPGINTVLTNLGELMGRAMRLNVIDEKTSEAFAHLDVAGYNYMDTRFDMDAELHPQRVIVSTESYPPSIDTEWAAVVRNPQVIGEFTWTGWDYLGEVGIGRIEHGTERTPMGMASFQGAYPWLAAWCGDIDITGHRRPQSYYREIVFGLRADPYIVVHRPEHHDLEVVHQSPWAFDDVVATWTWPGHEGAPVTVDVYADADEVELLVNGSSIGRAPADEKHRFRASFETTFEPGVIEAVAWRDGDEVGRSLLRSATGPARLEVRADRSELRADPRDLAFVELTLVDDAGTTVAGADRQLEVSVEGPAVLQGLASANPQSEEPFTGSSCTTHEGRAIAVVRPTGPGAITITVKGDGLQPQTATLQAIDRG